MFCTKRGSPHFLKRDVVKWYWRNLLLKYTKCMLPNHRSVLYTLSSVSSTTRHHLCTQTLLSPISYDTILIHKNYFLQYHTTPSLCAKTTFSRIIWHYLDSRNWSLDCFSKSEAFCFYKILSYDTRRSTCSEYTVFHWLSYLIAVQDPSAYCTLWTSMLNMTLLMKKVWFAGYCFWLMDYVNTTLTTVVINPN